MLAPAIAPIENAILRERSHAGDHLTHERVAGEVGQALVRDVNLHALRQGMFPPRAHRQQFLVEGRGLCLQPRRERVVRVKITDPAQGVSLNP